MNCERCLSPRMRTRKVLPGTIFLSLVLIMGLSAGKAGAVSECYDHWNGDAWHGSGAWAMVLCLDSATMTQCEVRHRDGGRITGLREHIALDRGRVIWTNYDNLTAVYRNVLLDVVCKDTKGFTYTFQVDNLYPSYWQWGACGEWGDYGGAACDDDQDDRYLKVVRAGDGSGTVTRSTPGINCSTVGTSQTCYHLPGTKVTLTANPSPGSIFMGWSGAGCSGTETCVVDIAEHTTVTATFGRFSNTGANQLLLKNEKRR